jgi:predicted short-subunit dehydrogenase-like oxidoreductase (DUF2520 family)
MRISIVGPGRLGSSIATQLAEAGYTITEIVGRRRALAGARKLAKSVGAKANSIEAAQLDADAIWFCVPDDQIAAAARQLATRDWSGKIALHSSGALTSNALDIVRRRGASAASVHPLMTFVSGSPPPLMGVPFALEGDAKAMQVAGQIVRRLGGEAFAVRKQDKTAYHAFATLICPMLVSLLATAEEVAGMAGIPAGRTNRLMAPIVKQTIANYARLGAEASFSGPIVRGDAQTVARHLRVLKTLPPAQRVYAALARAALRNLPAENRREIEQMLADAGSNRNPLRKTRQRRGAR